MLADCVGAGLRFVGCKAVGIGSCCINGRVAGLPVNVVQIAGSGGGGAAGTSWKGRKADAALFFEVKTVTAPAAAPIFRTLLLLRSPFLSGFAFFASLADLAMMLSFYLNCIEFAVPEAALVYITRHT